MRHKQLLLQPIGLVKNEIKQMGRHAWETIPSQLVIDPRFSEALDGLEEFSHVLVVFWMHESPTGGHVPLRTHPQLRGDLPLVGIFATRSPVRPNPVGISAVRLVRRTGNVLDVLGLDAIDGTPVLDIKPYLPGDSIDTLILPEWVSKLCHDTND